MITQMEKKKSVKSKNPCKSVVQIMWQLFGEEMDGIISEQNETLVA
jgi:hypothetical protein